MYMKGPAWSPETVVLEASVLPSLCAHPRLPAPVELLLCGLGTVFLLRFKPFLEQVSLLVPVGLEVLIP